LNVVTGAFGYTGRYIAQRLLSMGQRVKTLTGHPHRPNPFGEHVKAAPLDFDDPVGLARSLEGADTLYNTYWVRFPRGQVTFERAVENSRALIRAAENAGVRKFVHISITNASSSSHLPYFRGKGLVEEAIRSSRLSWAIIRPTVIFGKEDVLINNIAWALRRFPAFVVYGSGDYRLQPVFVEDVAHIAVSAAHDDGNVVIDAAGPETHTFEGLVRLIGSKTGSGARLVHLRPGLSLALTRLVGYLVNDVVLTRDEVEGLMASLLVSREPPTGKTRLSRWLEQNAGHLGKRYVSELRRHYQ
jgi:NADH dehydrogenase